MDWKREAAWLAVELIGEGDVALELIERQADLASASIRAIRHTVNREIGRWLLLVAFYLAVTAAYVIAHKMESEHQWPKRRAKRSKGSGPPPSWTGRGQ